MSTSLDRALKAIEAEAADVRERLAWLDRLAAELRGDTKRRPPDSGASRHRPMKTLIIEYLAAHPGSTAGAIADAHDLDPRSVASRLSQLVKGPNASLVKLERGYAVRDATAADPSSDSGSRAEPRAP